MAVRNDFETLRTLDEAVLDEVVHEAEVRLQAQFAAAAASDQRGMAWAGFMIAAATASLAASASLATIENHAVLSATTLLFAVMLLVSTFLAAKSVRPGKFCFPGNEPKNWLPHNWHGYGVAELNIHQARIEQAHALQGQIEENIQWADKTGKLLEYSMDIAMAAVFLVGIVVAIGLIFGTL